MESRQASYLLESFSSDEPRHSLRSHGPESAVHCPLRKRLSASVRSNNAKPHNAGTVLFFLGYEHFFLLFFSFPTFILLTPIFQKYIKYLLDGTFLSVILTFLVQDFLPGFVKYSLLA